MRCLHSYTQRGGSEIGVAAGGGVFFVAVLFVCSLTCPFFVVTCLDFVVACSGLLVTCLWVILSLWSVYRSDILFNRWVDPSATFYPSEMAGAMMGVRFADQASKLAGFPANGFGDALFRPFYE